MLQKSGMRLQFDSLHSLTCSGICQARVREQCKYVKNENVKSEICIMDRYVSASYFGYHGFSITYYVGVNQIV